MKKNVKGFIGLFAGIASFVLTGVAASVLTNKIEGTKIALHGDINVTMALIAAALGLVAIVFGILSIKHKDQKGPRKAGIIVGVFAVIIALAAAGICALTREIANYANGVPGNAIAQMDESQRESIDEFIKNIRTDAATSQNG